MAKHTRGYLWRPDHHLNKRHINPCYNNQTIPVPLSGDWLSLKHANLRICNYYTQICKLSRDKEVALFSEIKKYFKYWVPN